MNIKKRVERMNSAKMEVKYKIDISFTYVDEVHPENEQPGTCDITTQLFERFFQLCFKGCEMISCEKKGTSFECVFKTRVEYRFKVSGRMAKVADIAIIVVS